MAESKNFKKYILYLVLIFPLTVFLIEIFSSVIISFVMKQNSFHENTRTKFDLLTGWRQNCDSDQNDMKLPKDIICNRHGLAKTPFSSSNISESIGVLLLGNSVAMGEGLYSKNNYKTFASQLENHLRKKNNKVDLVNGAYSGFNSWQEHVETARYLNSNYLYNDLPSLSLIVSFGGIQDFWGFLKLLVNNSNQQQPFEYKYANGLMIHSKSIKYLDYISSSYTGNVISAINGLVSALSQKSYTYKLLKNVRHSAIALTKSKIDKSELIIDTEGYNSLTDLRDILNRRFSIDYKKYIEIRDYFISSVVRNITATSVMLYNKGHYVYIYAPTYFSTLNTNRSDGFHDYLVTGISHLIDNNEYQFEIYEGELKIVENDYRVELLRRLSEINSIIAVDYSDEADGIDWFIDYSHFNEYGANVLSQRLSSYLIRYLNE